MCCGAINLRPATPCIASKVDFEDTYPGRESDLWTHRTVGALLVATLEATAATAADFVHFEITSRTAFPA